MYLIYNIILLAALPLILVYHLYRSISRGRPAALRERFGLTAGKDFPPAAGQRPIWVHAVSVGETVAVRPLLKAIKARYPKRPLVVSNMTETGRQVASGFPEIDLCIYFPFDYRFAVGKVLQAVNPAAIVIVETELWPNFLLEARRLGIPAMIANGRISDRSFTGYLRARGFFRPVLANVACFCMQSEEDARRIVVIGAPAERVTVARNLKFDIPASSVSASQRSELRHSFGIPPDAAVITAGSTHNGEDELIALSYLRLVESGLNPFLVIVPRHPERSSAVAELIRSKNLLIRRRSELSQDALPFSSGEVLLVDTVGELMQFYALADIAFVGGSLVPIGGHNLLEPASLGVPVLFGPHMANFREIAALVDSYGAGCEVASGEALTDACQRLIEDPVRRCSMGEAGVRLLRENAGATERHLSVLESMVDGDA